MDVEPIELLAEEFIERHRKGECPTIASYVYKYPDLAIEIEDLFPTIAAMEQLKIDKEVGQGPASLGADQITQLGDYEIIREIGRGGMGIVYKARQKTLNRDVAIKVLPRQLLVETNALKRFQREAQIAGRLHHTNIVSVFGVGEQDGFHYYIMQFIQGVGLDKIIDCLAQKHNIASVDTRQSITETNSTNEIKIDTRKFDNILEQLLGQVLSQVTCNPFGKEYYRNTAKMGLQVAEALRYAHSQGTLHRDIKPANLLIDAYAQVWITDFGLAKALHSEPLTRTGEVAGTLRYMAPEQFEGITDNKSDIYSLGLTLYECLALRPAFCAKERADAIGRIVRGEITPLNKFNPSIPRDLETIIQKAIACDPQQRYATAGHFVADLRNFLNDRPIRARRVGNLEKIWLWARRNRITALLLVLLLIMLVAFTTIVTIGYVQTKKALAGEAKQRQRAEKQRRRAEANAEIAVEALDRIFTRLAPPHTIKDKNPISLNKVNAAVLLGDILKFYDRLSLQVADGGALQRRIANARQRVGYIRSRLGQNKQAIVAYRRAALLYKKLDKKNAKDPKFKIELARVHNELGQLYFSMKKYKESHNSHRLALSILRGTNAEKPAEMRYELARTHYFLSAEQLHKHPPREKKGKEGQYDKKPPRRERWDSPEGPPPWNERRPPPPHPGDRPPRHRWENNPVMPRKRNNDKAPKPPRIEETAEKKAMHHLKRAMAILILLVKEKPSTKYRLLLTMTYSRLGDLLIRQQEQNKAYAYLQKSNKLLRNLLTVQKNSQLYQIAADNYRNFAKILHKLGKTKQAKQATKMVELYERKKGHTSRR